jgi:ABC-type uncharacterized transport system YnjBCD ATPase subunit
MTIKAIPAGAKGVRQRAPDDDASEREAVEGRNDDGPARAVGEQEARMA